MRIRFIPKPCGGIFQAPPSKSVSHRALILANAAEEDIPLSGMSDCEDVLCTKNALDSLHRSASVYCGDSASTLRFLIPYAAALGSFAFFTGSGQLSARPVSLYARLFADCGVYCGSKLPLTVSGRLNGGSFSLPSDVSSQYASGLLLSASRMSRDLQVSVPQKANSLPYIRLSVSMMRDFGMTVNEEEFADCIRYFVPGGQKPSASSYTVEGDWSNGAFWLCLGLLCASENGLSVRNLNPDSFQGDKTIVGLLQQAGGRIEFDNESFRVYPSRLTRLQTEVSAVPDLFPLLSALAAFSEGISEFRGVSGLQYKESDRISGMIGLLAAFGVRSEYINGIFRVYGGNPSLPEEALSCRGDHRLAMAAALLSLGAGLACELSGAECIRKSWPRLWDELSAAGLCEEAVL